jgi:hypothetical protein
MAVNLSPVGGVAAQFFDNDGNVLSGGKIFTYSAGTNTPAATYTSSNGTIAHSNPIILDSAGRVPSGEIWLTDGINYKFVLNNSSNVLIGTYDNISGINSNFISFTNSQQIITATANQTVFNLSISYQPGTNSLSVFVDGVNQYGPGAQYAYTETDSDTVTFVSGLHVGAQVKFTTSQQQGAGAVDASQVTYDPPFTGSVATNVEVKLSQTISVTDFGAVGDGVTDDTNAIKAALSAVLSGPDRVLIFPSGKYLVTDTLNVYSGTSLIGGGQYSQGAAYSADVLSDVTINFQPTSQKNLFHVQRTAAEVSASVQYGSKVTIRGMKIVGNNSPGSNSKWAIYNDNMMLCSYEDLGIYKFQIGVYNSSTLQNTYKNIVFSTNSDASIYYDNNISTTDVYLNCYLSTCLNWHVTIESALSIKFIGCIFESANAGGLNLYTKASDIELIGCYGEDCPGNGTTTGTSFARVGVSGASAPDEAPQLRIIGGSFAGANSGPYQGTFLEVDKAYSVTVSGVHATRYVYGVSATANTQDNAIQLFGFTNQSVTTLLNGTTGKISGIYSPMPLGSGGSASLFTKDAYLSAPRFVRAAGTGSVQLISDSGTPEGAYDAPVGSIYLRTDGSTSTTLYVKTSGSGNTGWTAK